MQAIDKSAWERVTFGDVVHNVNETVRDLESAGIDRIIAMEHMDPGELKIRRWGAASDGTTFTRRVTPGQTLFGKRRAYQRKVAYAEFEGVCSSDIYTFEAVPARMLKEFLPFVVQSDGFFDHALGTSAGSLSPRTNWRDLANFEFDLPPLDEQTRIADMLWALERHRLEVLEQSRLGALTKSIALAERLGLGMKTNGWARQPVTALVTAGPTNGRSAPANDELRGVPTLSISAVRDGQVQGGDAVKYIDIDAASVSNFVLKIDDFLIVRGNGNRQLTGRGGLVSGGLPLGCIYPDLLIRLRFNPSVMLPQFAAEQWNSAEAHGALLENAKSTNGIWKINGADIKHHSLVVPPLADQVSILNQLESFDAVIRTAAAEADALSALRTSLLATIFGGN
ncbi:MAG TPA: restriction endonuclease subunit S [Marmoricola sp.]|nr:restriction endonuclease subunit S [Marmoricola sp.]